MSQGLAFVTVLTRFASAASLSYSSDVTCATDSVASVVCANRCGTAFEDRRIDVVTGVVFKAMRWQQTVV